VTGCCSGDCGWLDAIVVGAFGQTLTDYDSRLEILAKSEENSHYCLATDFVARSTPESNCSYSCNFSRHPCRNSSATSHYYSCASFVVAALDVAKSCCGDYSDLGQVMCHTQKQQHFSTSACRHSVRRTAKAAASLSCQAGPGKTIAEIDHWASSWQ